MTNNIQKIVEDPQKESSTSSSFITACLIPILVSIIVAAITSLITIHLQSVHERPNIKILGIMPIHLYGKISGINNKKFSIHKLAFIFKIENTSTIFNDGSYGLD